MQFKTFFFYIRNDFKFNRGKSKGIKSIILTVLFNPKFQLLFNYRVSVYLSTTPFAFLNIFIKYINLIVFSSEISPRATIGNNFKTPHPIGIVIGDDVVIGDNVVIYQNVTLGAKNRGKGEYPVLKNNIIVFANSTIVGEIEISNNIIIGANSMVISDCKIEGGIYAGLPARKI